MYKTKLGYTFDTLEKANEFNNGAYVCFSGCRDKLDVPDTACHTCCLIEDCIKANKELSLSANGFFESVLRKIIKAQNTLIEVDYFKNLCICKLNDDTLVKVSICDHTCIDTYSWLRIEVINKSYGIVDTQYLTFGDIIGYKKLWRHSSNMISPYIKKDEDSASWYSYEPTEEDYTLISNRIIKYISFYNN